MLLSRIFVMARMGDIEELFVELEEIISSLTDSYENAKKNTSILEISRVKVKSAFEHLRSILDYCVYSYLCTRINQLTNSSQLCEAG